MGCICGGVACAEKILSCRRELGRQMGLAVVPIHQTAGPLSQVNRSSLGCLHKQISVLQFWSANRGLMLRKSGYIDVQKDLGVLVAVQAPCTDTSGSCLRESAGRHRSWAAAEPVHARSAEASRGYQQARFQHRRAARSQQREICRSPAP